MVFLSVMFSGLTFRRHFNYFVFTSLCNITCNEEAAVMKNYL